MLESDIPVLVDYWAPWGGPCRASEPVIEELARTAGVMSIPHLVLYRNGRALAQTAGARSKDALRRARG